MSKKEPTAPAEDEVTELVDGTPETRDDALARANACHDEVAEVLAKHRCRILPHIDPSSIEPVGVAGDKVQITATFWIAPLA